MKTDDINTVETVLTEEELETYKPEEINAVLDTGDFYVCGAYYTKDAPI
jgi:hypothetical protein